MSSIDLAIVLLIQGKTQAALAEARSASPAGGQLAGMAVVYYALHRNKEADAVLARLEAEHSGDTTMWIAETYTFRGQKDDAFKWLEVCFAQKDFFLHLIKGDPPLKNLESHRRYKSFLRRMNLPE